MATPKCPQCQRTTFEKGSINIDPRIKRDVINCASCGTIVSVVPPADRDVATIREIVEKLKNR